MKINEIVVARIEGRDKFLATYKGKRGEKHLVKHYNNDKEYLVDEVAIPNSVLTVGTKKTNLVL